MRFNLFYTQDPERIWKTEEVLLQHRHYSNEYIVNGKLLALPSIEDLLIRGTVGIFISREAANDFVKHDPFVISGIVAHHNIRETNHSLD